MNSAIEHIQTVAKREGTEEQFALRDILTDLRHAAEELRLDFEYAVNTSFDVYEEEREVEA